MRALRTDSDHRMHPAARATVSAAFATSRRLARPESVASADPLSCRRGSYASRVPSETSKYGSGGGGQSSSQPDRRGMNPPRSVDRPKSPPRLPEHCDHLRSGGVQPQRQLEQASFCELVEPGACDRVRAGGEDDPVVRSSVGEPGPADGANDPHLVAAVPQRPARFGCDLTVDVDAEDAPARSNQNGEQRRVVPGAGADLEHAHPLSEIEPLEHHRHDCGLRRGAERRPVRGLLRHDRLVPVRGRQALPAANAGTKCSRGTTRNASRTCPLRISPRRSSSVVSCSRSLFDSSVATT